MFQNLLKISLRLLWRDRFFTLLNIGGLAVGMASAILMFLWVSDEMTFDHFQTRGARIYRVLTNWKFGQSREWTPATPAPLKEEAFESTPGIDLMVRTYNLGEQTFATGPNRVSLENTLLAENGFLEIFDFKFLIGNAQTALAEPMSIVLTESAAIKVFGKIPTLGTTLHHSEKGDFAVSAVIKDLPTNTNLKFDCVMPWERNILNFTRNPKNAFNWGQINYGSWVLLRPDAYPAEVANRFSELAGKFRTGDDGFYFGLQNIRDIHLYSSFIRWGDGLGKLQTIQTVGLIGLFVLLIACINYINLTTARIRVRAKSVGIRQTIGAGKWHLFVQAMTESALTICAALGTAGVFVWLALPWFEKISGKAFTQDQVFSLGTGLVFGITALVSWILSGIQPAVQITRFKPATALKGNAPVEKKAWIRKSLVVGQFVFSIGLGICSLLIFKQLQFAREKELGFDRTHTFMVFVPDNKAVLFKAKLQNQPGIQGITICDNPFVDLGSQCSGDNWEGKQPDQPSEYWQINVDADFPQIFDLKLTEGRWFRPGDVDSLSFIINEAAVKQMQLKDPIGKWVDHGGLKGTIVGVAKDFHFQSLHTAIEPMIFSQFPNDFYVMNVKTTGRDAGQAIASTQKIFAELFPDKFFKYDFLDDLYNDLYKSDARVGTIIGIFTGLSLFISCLGLFGLAAFAATQRTKEIGIRKVLGASIAGITNLLTKEFLQLILVSFVIASPIAYFLMQKWLADFAYRITIGSWAFILAGTLAIMVAFLTVGFQSIKAAMANPVNSLRSE